MSQQKIPSRLRQIIRTPKRSSANLRTAHYTRLSNCPLASEYSKPLRVSYLKQVGNNAFRRHIASTLKHHGPHTAPIALQVEQPAMRRTEPHRSYSTSTNTYRVPDRSIDQKKALLNTAPNILQMHNVLLKCGPTSPQIHFVNCVHFTPRPTPYRVTGDLPKKAPIQGIHLEHLVTITYAGADRLSPTPRDQ